MTPAGARLLALGATGALALGACGGDPQPIPRDQAAALIADLEEAKRRVDSGACDDLERGTFVRLDRRVEQLPADVDGGVEQALRDGVSHLKNLAEEECPANRPAAPATSTTPEPAPESTTTTQPEQPKGDDTTTTTTTTPTDPPPKSPEPPSETPGKGKGQPPSDGGSGGTPGQSGQEEG